MKKLIPIILVLLCSSTFAQNRSGFAYSHNDSISVKTVAKINGQWDTLQAIGWLRETGIADCRKSQLIDNRIDLFFDTVIVQSGKVLPAFSFKGFELRANAGTGFGCNALVQLEAELQFKWFTDIGLWVSPVAGYFDKLRAAILGGISVVLFSTH